jgi:hypothetical protein
MAYTQNEQKAIEWWCTKEGGRYMLSSRPFVRILVNGDEKCRNIMSVVSDYKRSGAHVPESKGEEIDPDQTSLVSV